MNALFLNKNVLDFGNFDEHTILLNNEFIPEAKQDNYRADISGLWLEKDEKIYYFKTVSDDYSLLAEFVGEKVSEYFNLETVHYHLATGKDKNKKSIYGLASEYMVKPNCFYQTWEQYLREKNFYGKRSVNDLSILELFEQDFMSQPIIEQTKAFFIRELLTNEDDRNINELLIKEVQDRVSLGYLVDYATECRLPYRYCQFVPFGYKLSLRDFGVVEQIVRDDTFQKYVEKALLFQIKRTLKEIKEMHSLLIPKEIEENFEHFFGKSQDVLAMYLSR